ncbi:hypothetical protein P7C70_g7861, partial [Phenoliferia sp. Uapishka_3]
MLQLDCDYTKELNTANAEVEVRFSNVLFNRVSLETVLLKAVTDTNVVRYKALSAYPNVTSTSPQRVAHPAPLTSSAPSAPTPRQSPLAPSSLLPCCSPLHAPRHAPASMEEAATEATEATEDNDWENYDAQPWDMASASDAGGIAGGSGAYGVVNFVTQEGANGEEDDEEEVEKKMTAERIREKRTPQRDKGKEKQSSMMDPSAALEAIHSSTKVSVPNLTGVLTSKAPANVPMTSTSFSLTTAAPSFPSTTAALKAGSKPTSKPLGIQAYLQPPKLDPKPTTKPPQASSSKPTAGASQPTTSTTSAKSTASSLKKVIVVPPPSEQALMVWVVNPMEYEFAPIGPTLNWPTVYLVFESRWIMAYKVCLSTPLAVMLPPAEENLSSNNPQSH